MSGCLLAGLSISRPKQPPRTPKSFGKSIRQRHALGLVAQWITRLTTDQKIAGSNPAEIVLLFS